MNEPTIQIERLLLTPFTRADAADVFAYASNPNVARFTSWRAHRTMADSEAFIDMVLGRSAHKHTWAIRLSGMDSVIGAIEFGLQDQTSAEFHYVLAEPFWNRGLMTEAARAVVDWGLKNYPSVVRVATRAMSENVASQRVMEKCGMKFEKICVSRFSKFPEPVEERQYMMIRQAMKPDR